MYDAGNLEQVLCDNLEGWGGGGKWEGALGWRGNSLWPICVHVSEAIIIL